MVEWKCIDPTRYFGSVDGYQVAAVYQDSTGGIVAWVWLLSESQKRYLGPFVTVGRALEAVDNEFT